MPVAPTEGPEREERLNAILLDYVEAVEAGNRPDRQELVSRYPEFRADLEEFFAGRDHLENIAAPLRRAVRTNLSGLDRIGGIGSVIPPTKAIGAADAMAEPATLGDFRLVRELGRGGMGVVYEAYQISLDRRVAVKLLPFAAALDAKQLQRFQNEAKAAALLHHPNIVPVYFVGHERGVHYYAMQFIEGQSLAALIRELRQQHPGPYALENPAATGSPDDTPRGADATGTGPAEAAPSVVALSTQRSTRRRDFYRRIADLVRLAAGALEYAHQVGIVHRDVKPANLLLDARGTIWITDFGLAMFQAAAGLTMTGELVGTLRYMSPEQTGAHQGVVDHRTDVYSLGVTLYELLTLHPLFECEERHHLLRKIDVEEPLAPRSFDKSIPVELETIVLKAIAKAPSDRYPTAQEFANDLGRFLADQPIQARRPTVLDKITKWSRRHRGVVTTAVILLLVLVAALTVATIVINHERSQAAAAYARELQKSREADENFRQARRAVDFFTQLSEEELADKPGLLEVRQRLLEAALAYNRDFVQQRQDDPGLRAELDASNLRVARLHSELTAMRGLQQLGLLRHQAVLDDLGVSPQETQRITEIAKKVYSEERDLFYQLRKLDPDEQRNKLDALTQANQQQIAQLVTASQTDRLKQIALQVRGAQAFDDPEVISRLGLSAEQRSRIRTRVDELVRSAWQNRRPDDTVEASRLRIEALRKEARDRALQVLAPQQRARWQALVGAPFEGTLGPGGGSFGVR